MADVGLRNINNVITGLKDMGYVLQLDNKRKKLQKKKELLDRWMGGFAETLPEYYKRALPAIKIWLIQSTQNAAITQEIVESFA